MLTTESAAVSTYRRDLGNGLTLRWATAEDTENIAQLSGMVFRSKADEPINDWTVNEVRRLMRGDHPLMGPGDYAVIEDSHKEGNPLVASTCLWRQEWAYEGIPFRIGRPEIVATDPAYRNRGLIRALFEMIHARSEAEGHPVQAITGIPYFYRQFGYEYALDLDGRRVTYFSLIPKAKEGEPEPYTLREATVEDIPLISECYNKRRAQSVVWTEVSEYYRRYAIEGWKVNPEHGRHAVLLMIVDAAGGPCGYLATEFKRWGRSLGVWEFEVAPGMDLHAVMPPILRALQAYAMQMPMQKPDEEPASEIAFRLGRLHPVYDVLGQELAPYCEPPYAWYVRVHDLPAFLQLIAPALEKRLADSEISGYTGELKLDFYRGPGLRMVFEHGRLTVAEPWRVPTYDSNASAGFPPLVFLQLLFGHRSIKELTYAFPDVWVNNDSQMVLRTLFPTRPSFAMPL